MSSKRAQRRREKRRKCSNKIAMSPDAARALAHKKSNVNRLGLKFDAYHCKFCDDWHIGHRPKGVQRQIDSRRFQDDT